MNLPRCKCGNRAKFAGDIRCEDCFADAMFPADPAIVGMDAWYGERVRMKDHERAFTRVQAVRNADQEREERITRMRARLADVAASRLPIICEPVDTSEARRQIRRAGLANILTTTNIQ